MADPRFITSSDQGVKERKVPIPSVLIAATTEAGADTFYTVRTGVAFQVNHLVVSNIGTPAVAITLHSIPSGGTIGAGNIELGAVDVPANESINLTDRIGGFYSSGETLKVYAATTNRLVIHGWGTEIL